MPDSEEIMTLLEVAQYLKVAEKSVLRMVRRGELPGTKVASQWRFFRSVIDRWLHQRMQPRADAAEAEPGLSRMLTASGCLLDLTPGDKPAILRQLAAPLTDSPVSSPTTDELVARLMAREEMVSTAVGHGVALPHLRNPLDWPAPSPRLVFGRCRAGVDFGSLDGAPVTLFFLPRPLNDLHHVKVMGRLGALLGSPANRAALLAAHSFEEVESLLLTHEQSSVLAP